MQDDSIGSPAMQQATFDGGVAHCHMVLEGVARALLGPDGLPFGVLKLPRRERILKAIDDITRRKYLALRAIDRVYGTAWEAKFWRDLKRDLAREGVEAPW